MRCFAAVVIAVITTASVAHAGVEFGGLGGLHTFSEDGAFGVVDEPSNRTTLKNSSLFGLRLGVYFGKKLGVEAEAGVIPNESRSLLFNVWSITYRAQLIYQARAGIEKEGVLLPFALIGAGVHQLVKTDNPDIVKKDSEVVPYIGVGSKYRTTGGWGVRVDLRLLLPPGLDSKDMMTAKTSGFAPEVEILLGFYKEFGRKVVKKKEEPPPPKDDDPDKDGIVGAADKCPAEAEDKDGFEDANGCPDLDNDGDGIPDATDKCPLAAEDKDSFEDTDGCPDLDNDADGVPDAADKCVEQPETKNGYLDDDGCPDEIPETLRQFTGVIQGINFKVSAADLVPGSNKILDKAIAVLAEFKDVKLEIQGHTDDVATKPGGKYADNVALSQARAETVKAYFVSKGIEEGRLVAKGYGEASPIEDPKGLTGQKLNNARTKNRRVEFKLVMAEGAPMPTPPKAEPVPKP